MTAPWALAALVSGSFGLSLAERDQVSSELAVVLMGKVRAAIERRTQEVVVEGVEQIKACGSMPQCIEVRVRAFGGPLHLHVILERKGMAEVEAQATCDLSKERIDRWDEILDGALDHVLAGWSKPGPQLGGERESLSAVVPPRRERSLVVPLILGSAAIASSVGAVAFAVSARSTREDLRGGLYTADQYDPLVSSLHRKEGLAEGFWIAAAVSAAASVVVYLLDL